MSGDREVAAIAAEILAARDGRRQISPLTARVAGFDVARAYAVTAVLRSLRRARGETPVGRKIGFTNRAIWAEYGVDGPIWGDMYDTTVRDLPPSGGRIALSGFCEPQIEPEIVVGFASAPQPGMDEGAILGCIGWIAHGFEIVDSLFPGWRFTAADTVAAGGLHGMLLLGRRCPVVAGDATDWASALPAFDVALAKDGETIDRGRGANVLGGPLSALRQLVALLARDPANPPLAAGEIVTTGTLTRAFRIAAGQTWTTRIDGLPLPGLSVTFG